MIKFFFTILILFSVNANAQQKDTVKIVTVTFTESDFNKLINTIDGLDIKNLEVKSIKNFIYQRAKEGIALVPKKKP